MSAETDRAELAGLDELDPCDPLSRDRVAAALRAMAREDAPRRFALYTVTEHDHGFDGEIIAWGLGIDEALVVHSPCGRFRGSFGSPTSMLRLLRSHGDVRLLWLDGDEAAGLEPAACDG